MESWRKVFREGLAPLVSTKALECLRKALIENDCRLLQGATTTPPPLECVSSWSVEACCALAYIGWQGEELNTVAEVEKYFSRLCYEIDLKLGEPAAIRYFLNFWDDTPREIVFKLVLEEVNLELENR